MSKAREALAAIFDHAVACGVRAEQHESFSTGSFAAKRYRKEAEAARDALLDAATPEPEAAPAAQAEPVPMRYVYQVTECEACLTEDACRIRGQCAFYLRREPATTSSPKPSQAGPVQGEWISVEERLPEPGQSVLFWEPLAAADQGGIVNIGRKDPEGSSWWDDLHTDRDGDSTDCYGVTHWMPLPMPPAASSEGQQPGGAT